ncbi:MAG: hypothetical protein IKF18_00890 [Erysipelotrichaceae bacterium]|nr:hypothetical protein [Erysipelotrichaceae bacterium]
MNSNVFSLTAALIKNNLSPFGKNRGKLGIKILYVILFAYLFGLAAYGSYWLLSVLIPLKQEKIFIGFILSSTVAFVFVQSILSCASFFYFAKENEFLLPLPLKSKEILAAKTAVSLIYIYFTELFIGLVPLFCYGYFTSQPLYFYLLVIPVLLILPIFPICISSFLIILLFSLINLTRYKSIFHVISILFAISFSLGISLFVNSGDQSSAMMDLLNRGGDLLELYKGFLPTISFAIDALKCSDLITSLTSFTVLVLISVLVFVLYLFVSDKLFMKGLLNSLYGTTTIVKKSVNEKSFRSKGIALSYISKEFKNLLRNSVYLTQLILPALLVPFIILFAFGFSLRNNADDISIVLRIVERWLFSDEASIFVVMILFGLLFFTSMYVYISITGISRDGEDALFMKQIPIPFYKQLIYKAVPDSLFTFFGYAVMIVIILIFIRVPAKYILMSIIAGILYSYIHGLLFLVIDLMKPKLHWQNEYEVVKNNFSIFYVILFAIINFCIMAALYLLKIHDYLLYYSIIISIYLLMSAALTLYIRKKDIRLADRLY